jgi:hypothetical protein
LFEPPGERKARYPQRDAEETPFRFGNGLRRLLLAISFGPDTQPGLSVLSQKLQSAGKRKEDRANHLIVSDRCFAIRSSL